MKAKIKHWAGYFGKWDFLPVEEHRFGGKEVEIDNFIVEEYNKTIEKLKMISDLIWKVYNGKV